MLTLFFKVFSKTFFKSSYEILGTRGFWKCFCWFSWTSAGPLWVSTKGKRDDSSDPRPNKHSERTESKDCRIIKIKSGNHSKPEGTSFKTFKLYIYLGWNFFLFILIFYLNCNYSVPGRLTERCVFPLALKQSNSDQLLFLYLLLISYEHYAVCTAKSRDILVFREIACFALWALAANIWSGGCSELGFKNIH